MGIFKDDEVYDYTFLQKKGFLKKSEEKKPLGKVSRDGYIELGTEDIVKQKTENADNPLGFFDTFAPGAVSESSPLANFDVVSSSGASSGVDTKDLAVKIEDFEFKLSRIADKLAKIEEKLSKFEEKVC